MAFLSLIPSCHAWSVIYLDWWLDELLWFLCMLVVSVVFGDLLLEYGLLMLLSVQISCRLYNDASHLIRFTSSPLFWFGYSSSVTWVRFEAHWFIIISRSIICHLHGILFLDNFLFIQVNFHRQRYAFFLEKMKTLFEKLLLMLHALLDFNFVCISYRPLQLSACFLRERLKKPLAHWRMSYLFHMKLCIRRTLRQSRKSSRRYIKGLSFFVNHHNLS